MESSIITTRNARNGPEIAVSDLDVKSGSDPTNIDNETCSTKFIPANDAVSLTSELNDVADKPILERIEPVEENADDLTEEERAALTDALVCRSRGGTGKGNAVNAPAEEDARKLEKTKRHVLFHYFIHKGHNNVRASVLAGYGSYDQDGNFQGIPQEKPPVNLFKRYGKNHAVFELIDAFLDPDKIEINNPPPS